MTPTTIGRRTLLGLLGGSALGLLVGCSTGADREERACDAVAGAVPDAPAGLLAIGVRYRQLQPDDDIHAIESDLPEEAPDALAELAGRVRADFETGDIVDVDGWVLARTEARAAALLAGC